MKKYLLTLVALLILSASAWPITGLSIGVHTGLIAGYNYDLLNSNIAEMASSYGWNQFKADKHMTLIGAHANIGFLNIIDVTGFVDYSWKKTKLASNVDLKLSDISFGFTGIKRFGLPFVDPYIGAGMAWHHFVYTLETSSTGIIVALPDNQTKIGYHIAGGVRGNIPMFPLAPYVEYKYNLINTEQETTTFSTIVAGLSIKF